MKLVLYTDGGARGNPGPAGIGVVIENDAGKELKLTGEYIGEGTNNQAEYKALLKGLIQAAEMGADEITCYLDSELVVKQLSGLYRIKEAGLQALAAEILKLTSKFRSIQYKHVPRERNARADKLVNQALDEQMAKQKSA
jgi:ribonuclease HI